MWKKVISILFALGLTGCAANASTSFAHTAAIETGGENQYKAVRLTPQIYNASNSDLSDLLIKDGNGENVPYFINTGSKKAYSSKENYEMSLINSYISEETYFIEVLEPAFTIESGDRRTNIIIEGLRNLRLCDVTLHTGSMFKRNVSTPHGTSKELYNLTLNDTSYADTTIPLNWNISQDEIYNITIADGDDKPITISSITVRYYADDVVFDGKTGGNHTLEFGRDATKAAPVYDIERYKNDILKGTIDKTTIGEIHYITEEIASERDYKLVFNIVIIVVTLLLGTVILLKLKKK